MVNGVARRALAVAAGLVVDRWLGEPPRTLHPVARFGQAMEWLEGYCWRDERRAGVLYAALGVVGAAAAGELLECLLGVLGATGVAVALCSASRSLFQTATDVAGALEAGDLPRARCRVRALVGRDVDELGEADIARAVVESLAENLSDAVVASAWWGLVGGASGALAHRGVNTLDAMVGYPDGRYGRFGWAAARLDDLMAWPAARLTVLAVAMARPWRARAILHAVTRQARGHPSPNAGVVEAAFAAALGVRLGGSSRYRGRLEVRPICGFGRPPQITDIGEAVELGNTVVGILIGVLAVPGLAGGIRAMKRTIEGGRVGSPRSTGIQVRTRR